MTTWGTIDRPDWTDLVSFSNIGPYILPPEETNFDLVVQNSVTPSAHLTYNLGQKDLRYLNVWSENASSSNLIFQNCDDQLKFNGSYEQLRDKPIFGAPDYYEVLSFFPDKSLD